ncbi:MAG TPA: NAD-dependent epimerase/dehydratase family protein [Caulobacteraceae bacterium]|nr:NAD-dependent epimerase/dehydratase family protein [Caulobacteraceae bacterium]
MSFTTPKTALVIGATGGVGGSVARALLARGWHVRALNRHPDAAAKSAVGLANVEWIAGDAMKAADVIAAARGADLIVHGANPPGYRNWGGLVLPMLDSTIAAAKAGGARILFPGTVYNFGPDAGAVVDERSPQNPKTRKGAIRVEMERRLEAASHDGVRTVLVRAGDFFGPHTSGNSWFSNVLAQPGKPVRMMMYPGPKAVGHAWAYLPDLAETMVDLVERSDAFAVFEVFHFNGHWLSPGVEMAQAVRRVLNRPKLSILPAPWTLIRVMALFNETFREMLEMRYLWNRPLRLDNAKLVAALGAEPHTPLDRAVLDSLTGLGCMPADATKSSPHSATLLA